LSALLWDRRANWFNVSSIDFNGQRLLDQGDRKDQHVPAAIPNKPALHPSEDAPRYKHRVAFLQSLAGFDWQAAFERGPNGVNLVVRNRRRDSINTYDLAHPRSHEYRQPPLFHIETTKHISTK
jgi:hypothetical protein